MAKNHGGGQERESAESLTIFLAREGLTEPANLLKFVSGLKTFKVTDSKGELGMRSE